MAGVITTLMTDYALPLAAASLAAAAAGYTMSGTPGEKVHTGKRERDVATDGISSRQKLLKVARDPTNVAIKRAIVQPFEVALQKCVESLQETDDNEATVAPTMVDLLQYRALTHPSAIVYTFLDEECSEVSTLTFGELDRRARAVAVLLQNHGVGGVRRGERVILCYPPGLDFAIGFWGCLYAGVIAVPVYPPYPGTLNRDLPKFNKLVEDCGARVVLTDRTYHMASRMGSVKAYFGGASWPKQLTWYTTDNLNLDMAEDYLPLKLRPSDTAFFQYSSGSTSDPKAVIISHRNLRAQVRVWESVRPEDVMISWLPSYHDMGLVGFIVVPAVTGSKCVSTSPISFIKDPAIWLKMVTRYRGTHICAPNFGYALAARKISAVQAKNFKLGSIKQAICAAEPIRAESLAAFTERFESVGFKEDTYNCGYGLAECTLVCSGQDPLKRTPPKVLVLNKKKLENEQVVEEIKASRSKKKGPVTESATFVGCGQAMPGFEVVIVDTKSRRGMAENQVGEIWVGGDSVAEGYYNRWKQTQETFECTIQGRPSEKFMRTGDLGFIRKGELFVTGRAKDLIIIRGRNVAPQDVELSVEQAHSTIRPGCVAAFSIEVDEEERLVVIAELRSAEKERNTLQEISSSVSRNIMKDHQLPCFGILLIAPRTIPKTTSGKIQRHGAKKFYLSQTSKCVLHRFQLDHLAGKSSSSGLEGALKGNLKGKPSKAKSVRQSARRSTVPAPSEKEQSANPGICQENGGNKSIEHGAMRRVKEEDIEAWLTTRLKELTSDETIDSKASWASSGLDSVTVVNLSAELGNWLGCVVPPAAFFQYDSPFALAHASGILEGNIALSQGESEGVTGPASADLSSIIVDTDGAHNVPSSFYDIAEFPEYVNISNTIKEFRQAGLQVPYLQEIDRSRPILNYNTYNYLGIAGHATLKEASKKAIDEWGTTMSSSPIVGQNSINLALEAEIRDFLGTEGAVCFIGGWQANVSTISTLVGRQDLILADALNHDCCVAGGKLSGATVMPFPHNDWKQCEKILAAMRNRYRRVLIVIEGVYSMDGDIPDLSKFIDLKKKYKTMLFLDEAHSIGTLGKTGRGLTEHCGVPVEAVDIIMGTMSKAIGSQGGFICGRKELIDLIKYSAGGFVFSVGSSPANASSALAGLKLLRKEPSRIERLRARACLFYDLAKEAGLNVGRAVRGAAVIPVIVGSSVACVGVSAALSAHDINVKPIIYPAVEEGQARLRFFISAVRTEDEVKRTIAALKKEILSATAS